MEGAPPCTMLQMAASCCNSRSVLGAEGPGMVGISGRIHRVYFKKTSHRVELKHLNEHEKTRFRAVVFVAVWQELGFR